MDILSVPSKPTQKRHILQCADLARSKKNRLPSLFWAITVIGLAAVSASHASDGEDLQKAATTGDLQQVLTLLEDGTDVNFRSAAGAEGFTALIGASQNGHEEIVQTLLGAGAETNHEFNGYTALWLASANGHAGIVEALFAEGAKIDHKAGNGMTALEIACKQGKGDAVRALLAAGAEVSQAAKTLASLFGNEGVSKALWAATNPKAGLSYEAPVSFGDMGFVDNKTLGILSLRAGMTKKEIEIAAKEKNVRVFKISEDKWRIGNLYHDTTLIFEDDKWVRISTY